MGCKFFCLDGREIGKRFAAGVWCWDCRVACAQIYRHAPSNRLVTLAGGDHRALSAAIARLLGQRHDPVFADLDLIAHRCPQCGAEKRVDADGYNPALRELGFDAGPLGAHHGIDGASGFHWNTHAANQPLGSSRQAIVAALAKKRFVVDEYGERLTLSEFRAMFRDINLEREFADIGTAFRTLVDPPPW